MVRRAEDSSYDSFKGMAKPSVDMVFPVPLGPRVPRRRRVIGRGAKQRVGAVLEAHDLPPQPHRFSRRFAFGPGTRR